ncbi:hypothetical protein [Curtobacterium flaccumfaciens]|uniref:hypothetical protein n=1 Tax=Curtobacterium flaccumfaciens TaxID=2035 RepID=UPI00112CA9D5|nr:hypothetical protein [Curtobacterium flaccumfaciens]
MGVISSPQLGVRPFRMTGGVTLQQLRASMNKDHFNPASVTPTQGWGGVTDTDYAIGSHPGPVFDVGGPIIVRATSELPRRLRVRYYWMLSRPRARLAPNADSTDWRSRHRLDAADVLLYENADGSISGLTTTRDTRSVRTVFSALSTLANSIAASNQVTTDNLPEALNEDFFLWLVYRLQDRQQLTPLVRLGGIIELSSKDRSLRPARFSETVDMARIELAALIALGDGSFGPAKLNLDVALPALGADVTVHPDGGFQPLRSSTYEDGRLVGAAQATRLLDDLWVRVLPELRSAYAADADWQRTGRMSLRDDALGQVRALLRIATT